MKYALVLMALSFGIQSFAVESYLVIKSYEDFENDSNDLKEAKEFKVTEEFVSTYYIDFRTLLYDDRTESKCFVGVAKEAAKVVQAILDVPTGDSYVLKSQLKVSKDLIVHLGTFTEGSGDYDSDLDFEVARCQ